MPPQFTTIGGMIHMSQLDAAGAPPLLAIGFRITDNATEKWTQRFNRFKTGVEAEVVAGTRTVSAALRGTPNCRGVTFRGNPRVVVVGAISSRDGVLQEGSPVWRLGNSIASTKGWEWRPDLLRKTAHRSLHSLYNAAERDAEIAGRYVSGSVRGAPGIFVITDDFCTRGTTAGDIQRALRGANPGWRCVALALAKTERLAYWGPGLNNDHVPDDLDGVWQGH